MTDTFYDVLGVSPDAATEEIEAAYRDRLKETHPDLSDAEDASETTQRVIEARNVLTDEAEREHYDAVGHEAYVSGDRSAAEGPPADEDVGSAAAAARRAGWGDGTESSGRSGPTDGSDGRSGPTNPGSTGNRRAREHAARERVHQDRSESAARGAADVGGGSSASADGGTADAGATARARAAARRRRRAGASDQSPGWSDQNGYSVRREYEDGPSVRAWFATTQSFTMTAMALVLYPVMLFSAVFPPFQLVFNVIVGLCVLCLVGYLQSVPEVGVVVFGVWSVLTPLALIFFGVDPAGLQAVLALTGTLLPFGLSVASFLVLYR